MKKKISRKKLRDFGILFGILLPILVGWILPAFHGHAFNSLTIFLGLPGIILGLTFPRALYYPYKIWMFVGHSLGLINSYLILGLIFVLVLQPIAFIMRFFDYDPLKLKRNNLKTYREKRENHVVDLTRIF